MRNEFMWQYNSALPEKNIRIRPAQVAYAGLQYQ